MASAPPPSRPSRVWVVDCSNVRGSLHFPWLDDFLAAAARWALSQPDGVATVLVVDHGPAQRTFALSDSVAVAFSGELEADDIIARDVGWFSTHARALTVVTCDANLRARCRAAVAAERAAADEAESAGLPHARVGHLGFESSDTFGAPLVLSPPPARTPDAAARAAAILYTRPPPPPPPAAPTRRLTGRRRERQLAREGGKDRRRRHEGTLSRIRQAERVFHQLSTCHLPIDLRGDTWTDASAGPCARVWAWLCTWAVLRAVWVALAWLGGVRSVSVWRGRARGVSLERLRRPRRRSKHPRRRASSRDTSSTPPARRAMRGTASCTLCRRACDDTAHCDVGRMALIKIYSDLVDVSYGRGRRSVRP